MPKQFCRCWDAECLTDPGDPDCRCGEELGIVQWRWETHRHHPEWVDFYEDNKLIVFHPLFSSGTAIVKGNIGLEHNMQYYWEVKILTQPYGTDVMVGIGTNDVGDAIHEYTTCLGANENSYGVSYTGAIYHKGAVIDNCPGFCKGTIVGVMVDMFHGTVEFYLNREPLGKSFIGLRSHKTLFPMVSSTAALSSMRLTYASSSQNSLLINAAKVLAASVSGQYFFRNMPPGLARVLELDFWISLRSGGLFKENKSERNVGKQVQPRRFRNVLANGSAAAVAAGAPYAVIARRHRIRDNNRVGMNTALFENAILWGV